MTSLRVLFPGIVRIACLLLATAGLVAQPASPAAGESILAKLKPTHPRLIIASDTWSKLHARAASDPLLAAVLEHIVTDGRELLLEPPQEYRKVGRRLLGVSREVERRVLVLAAAFKLTGDPALLRRAELEMLTAAGFADWNPSHFLDVAEMTTALACGYDWLYADLAPGTRRTIREALLTKGLRPALDSKAKYNGWQTGENNWNQVCFGGMILGSLAIAEDAPDEAAALLTVARRQMPHGLKAYAPDGVYPEGPGYWGYGTTYSVMSFAALKTALGTDWGLSETPGFLKSAGAFVQMTSPAGLFFDYSDCGERAAFEPALFWFARRNGQAGLVAGAVRTLERALHSEQERSIASRVFPLTAVWWPERRAETTLPLRWYGDGWNPIAVFRSSWTDPNALYLALKGGSASLNHAHMDAGSFVFELDGVRWARDLGMQDYESLESKGVKLWDMKQGSQRWTVFRLNNRSHNTLTIDDQLHRVDGAARIVAFSADPTAARALVDLSFVFAGQAQQVRRGFRVEGDTGILVQDELSGLKPRADVCWTMTTAASVQVGPGGRSATLQESGQTLRLQLLAPTNAKVSVVSAEPPRDDYNAPNPGRRRVVIHASAPATGDLTIAVRLTKRPASDNDEAVQPLESWTFAK